MDKKFKKVFNSIKTRAEGAGSSSRSRSGSSPPAGTPEGDLSAAISLFVSTGGPDNPRPGEEFLHLPVIVDNAESSPSAAGVAATCIRRNLDARNSSRPYIHYNSIMLLRILAQNPGPTFTRHLAEAKFVGAVKELVRNGRDPSVAQILAETLDHFAQDPQRVADENLTPLREMWAKERGRRKATPPPTMVVPMPGHSVNNGSPPPLPPRINALPSPQELVARISEANTSAALLTQLIQSTPAAELAEQPLVREFVDRCKLAARSMQAYIQADDPAPDADTLTTLIETNDVLAIALEGHRKAVANAVSAGDSRATEGARVQDIGEVPNLHGAAPHQEHEGERQDLSPVSPLTPTASRREEVAGSSGVFRF